MLFQGTCANLGSLTFLLVFEHEELSKCAVVLTTERLSGYEWWENALLSISSHLSKHVLIILIFIVRDLWQSYLVSTILILIFF